MSSLRFSYAHLKTQSDPRLAADQCKQVSVQAQPSTEDRGHRIRTACSPKETPGTHMLGYHGTASDLPTPDIERTFAECVHFADSHRLGSGALRCGAAVIEGKLQPPPLFYERPALC